MGHYTYFYYCDVTLSFQLKKYLSHNTINTTLLHPHELQHMLFKTLNTYFKQA